MKNKIFHNYLSHQLKGGRKAVKMKRRKRMIGLLLAGVLFLSNGGANEQLLANGNAAIETHHTVQNAIQEVDSSDTKAVTANKKKAVFPENIIVGKNLELKVGETKKLPIKCPLDKNKKSLAKTIKCTVKNKKIASATKDKIPKITGKKAGTTTIKVKVTARNGAKKTFTTKVKVKSNKKIS